MWTVEIIPAEIRPPARSVAGASGNRIRLGSGRVTNGGDQTDLVVAFNEQVLLGRVRAGELKPGCKILLESLWRDHPDATIRSAYSETVDGLVAAGYDVHELAMDLRVPQARGRSQARKEHVRAGPAVQRVQLRPALARDQIALTFGKKAAERHRVQRPAARGRLSRGPRSISISRSTFRPRRPTEPQVVLNGNTALALGVLASGMEICAMYPITPATSASHYLSDVFEKIGGLVHQAEDEIAACAFAIGASYAGKCAVTITSGPGYSLKQEGIGLAVMAEIPLVVVNVQRGGPSTGQPTKTEQGDLLTAMFGSHGDAPKVVMAREHGRGLLLLDHHRAEDCGDVQHGGGRPVGRQPRHIADAVSTAGLRGRLDGAPGGSESDSGRREAVRLGRHHRLGPPVHPRPARRHAHRHGAGARSRQPRGVRPRGQRREPARAQPQTGGAAENAEEPAGLRRPVGRPAHHRLGQHQRGD